MTGNFLLQQLHEMDNAAGGKATFAFGPTAFVTALKSEVCPSHPYWSCSRKKASCCRQSRTWQAENNAKMQTCNLLIRSCMKNMQCKHCQGLPCLQVNSLRSHNPNAGISIRDLPSVGSTSTELVSIEDKQQQADADYARQLQAKLDAQEARGGPKSVALPCVQLPAITIASALHASEQQLSASLSAHTSLHMF